MSVVEKRSLKFGGNVWNIGFDGKENSNRSPCSLLVSFVSLHVVDLVDAQFSK